MFYPSPDRSIRRERSHKGLERQPALDIDNSAGKTDRGLRDAVDCIRGSVTERAISVIPFSKVERMDAHPQQKTVNKLLIAQKSE
jgi:hypothetical protein